MSERLRCYSHIDERCAGFFALGLAKASGLPVAVTCTSGTAAAELLPAAIEAFQARVPLLLLTADRPPELRENGAGQAIDQLKLFGDAAKWFFEVGTHEASPSATALDAHARLPRLLDGAGGPAGRGASQLPPARAARDRGDPLPDRSDRPSRTASRRYVRARRRVPTASSDATAAEARMRRAKRGVVVAGRHERSTSLGEAAAAFCEAAGWPLLADPLSGARRGNAAIAHYDALLRERAFAAGVARTSCSGSATCRSQSRCARGWRAWARSRRWRSIPRAPGRTRRRC